MADDEQALRDYYGRDHLREERDRYREALEQIAHHAREGDHAGQVNAMRGIALEALDG